MALLVQFMGRPEVVVANSYSFLQTTADMRNSTNASIDVESLQKNLTSETLASAHSVILAGGAYLST